MILNTDYMIKYYFVGFNINHRLNNHSALELAQFRIYTITPELISYGPLLKQTGLPISLLENQIGVGHPRGGDSSRASCLCRIYGPCDEELG